MRLALNYKDNRREVLDEENTKKVIGGINYLKLIKYLMGSKKLEATSVKILDKEVKIDELKSIEVLL